MDFSKLASQGLEALAEIAPTLAGLVGGPLAGTAVSAIESALGLTAAPGAPPAQTAETALAAVTKANPDQILALKAEDDRHAEALQKAGIDLETLASRDRDSARQREMAVKDHIPGVLAVGLTAGFFGLLAWLVGHEPPAGSRDILNIMLGSLGTGWATMVAYYFGSSKGADAANRLVGALSKG